MTDTNISLSRCQEDRQREAEKEPARQAMRELDRQRRGQAWREGGIEAEKEPGRE